MPSGPTWPLWQVSSGFQFPCPSGLVMPYRLVSSLVLLRNWGAIFIQLLGLVLWVIMRNRKSRPLLQVGWFREALRRGWGQWTEHQRSAQSCAQHGAWQGVAGVHTGQGRNGQPNPVFRRRAAERESEDRWTPRGPMRTESSKRAA